MTKAEFMRELAKLKGRFGLKEEWGKGSVLRTKDKECLCPVLAVQRVSGGPVRDNDEWESAAKFLNLSVDVACSIVDAADAGSMWKPHTVRTRAQLLKAVGL